jgi:hypothetical protein
METYQTLSSKCPNAQRYLPKAGKALRALMLQMAAK